MTSELYPDSCVDAQLFIDTVFPPDDLADDEVVLVAHPDFFIDDAGDRKDYYKNYQASPNILALIARQTEGWIFCVSTVRKPARGEKLRRRKIDAHTAWVIVLDDIGTKAEIPPVAPSYILETSPGNYQYGYLLDPFDTSTPEGERHFDACLLGFVHAGFNDPGCRGATRVVKVPGAVHKTGFISRIVEWAPERGWALDELMAEMGVAPGVRGLRTVTDPDFISKPLAEVDDRVYTWLHENKIVTGNNAEYVHLLCPWRHKHTDGLQGTTSSTSYSPNDYGTPGRHFHCRHAHCENRTTRDFLAWVHAEGGPDMTVPEPRKIAPALLKILGAK